MGVGFKKTLAHPCHLPGSVVYKLSACPTICMCCHISKFFSNVATFWEWVLNTEEAGPLPWSLPCCNAMFLHSSIEGLLPWVLQLLQVLTCLEVKVEWSHTQLVAICDLIANAFAIATKSLTLRLWSRWRTLQTVWSTKCRLVDSHISAYAMLDVSSKPSKSDDAEIIKQIAIQVLNQHCLMASIKNVFPLVSPGLISRSKWSKLLPLIHNISRFESLGARPSPDMMFHSNAA